jgi:hypothetical protein
MKHEKVVSIMSRQERWNTAYELNSLAISVSNHGRINITVDGKDVSLDLVDSVDMLGRVSEKLEALAKL